jgi:dihydrofolate reductase
LQKKFEIRTERPTKNKPTQLSGFYYFYEMNNNLVLYIASSQDGFISGESDDLSFLKLVEIEGEDYGYLKFINSVGPILVGRKTYDKVISMGFPYHENKNVYVISRDKKKLGKKKLTFFSNDISELVAQLKKSSTKNIYCDGGAELAKYLISKNLIDQIILSVVPVELKKGTLLFEKGIVPQNFQLKKTDEFESGLVQFTYSKILS